MEESLSTFLNLLSSIAGLLIALVSLIISVIALKISRKVYVFSSKDYIPEIEYSINDDDELTVINKSKDLFTMKNLSFIKIITIGFEDSKNQTYTQIPFITRSRLWWWFDNSQKVFLDKNERGACAYHICPYDENIVKNVYNRAYEEYKIDSEKGYALPSLQGVKYILEIVYDNSFQERKSVIFVKEHVHSYGYDYSKISEEQLGDILKKSNIPKFDDFEELWEYLLKTYTYNW